VNHFAGAFLMGRKDNLHNRMGELRQRAGDEFASFYPESYLLPGQRRELALRWAANPRWIIKPAASSRGRGIHLRTSAGGSPPADSGIVQVYIARPFLITKRKFDIRLYAYISSSFPLRIYMHNTGLARFCTHEYDEHGSPEDVHMHLTNFALNKDDNEFVRNADGESVEDSKWSLEFWLDYMKSNGFNTESIMRDMEHVTIATIIAGMCEIRKTHEKWIPHRHTSYELYGIDIMLDENLKANLIEINISPSLSGLDSSLDHRLKYPLNLDALRMARIIECDPMSEDPCPGVEIIDEHYEASITQRRRELVEAKRVDPWANPVFADFVMVRDYLEEVDIKTGFRLAYPRQEVMETFAPCFDKMCYQDVVFNAWVTMSEARKQAVLAKHWGRYTDEMQKIMREVTFEDVYYSDED
jgi:tubulin polyglutamylase TTLL4